MKKINFTNATVTAQASVEIDGVSHDVTPAVIEGGTLPTPDNINQLQNNVEEAILNPVVESIKSENQFNKDDCVDYYYLDYNNGQPVADINMSYMKSYISVKPNEKYTMSYSSPTIFVVYEYDSNKTFLRNKRQNTDATSFTVTISEDTYFVRLACGYNPKQGIVFTPGDTAVPYVPFKRYGYNSQESMGSIVVDDIRSKNFFDVNKITSTTVNGVTISKNANGGLVLNGTATGQIEFFYVELVSESKIKPGKTYTLSSNALPQDDKLQVFLQNSNSATWVSTIASITGTINPDTFTVSTLPGTHFKFLILILEGATLNNFVLYPQIEEGSTVTNYSEYKGIGYTSGQNANGKWVKYDDGRMECWGVNSYDNVEIKVLDITEYYAQLPAQPFPQAFISSPICVMSIDNVQPGYALQLKSTGNGATGTHTPMMLAFCAVSVTPTRIDVHYHACGYWK